MRVLVLLKYSYIYFSNNGGPYLSNPNAGSEIYFEDSNSDLSPDPNEEDQTAESHLSQASSVSKVCLAV